MTGQSLELECESIESSFLRKRREEHEMAILSTQVSTHVSTQVSIQVSIQVSG